MARQVGRAEAVPLASGASVSIELLPLEPCQFVKLQGLIAQKAVLLPLNVIVPATSLGGVESTIERRAKWALEDHLPPGLLRLSVGLEHVDDLWTDLEQALRVG